MSIEVDQPFYAVGNPVSHLRKLVETLPHGISMILQNMTFWDSLDGPTGTIKLCIADTGYDLGHIDLPDGDGVNGANNDEYPDEVWYKDGNGHGTHCSGTVAAIGNNSQGVIGVIPNNTSGHFQLVIGSALDASGSGTGAGVLQGVQTCVENGAKVISLSLGGSGYSPITEQYYQDLFEFNDTLIIAAAGNAGDASFLYPASYPAVISVAAIDSNKDIASFSQYNSQVEISAPGVEVMSTIPDDQYISWNGTSMATPHVAGVAGLLWMHFPECKNYEIRNVLDYTAEDINTTGCDINSGYGLVQAKNAFGLLSGGNCGGNVGKTSPVGGCNQLVDTNYAECTSDRRGEP